MGGVSQGDGRADLRDTDSMESVSPDLGVRPLSEEKKADPDQIRRDRCMFATDKTFRVTYEWIMEHRTERGAWTAAQWRALGIPTKNNSGWIRRCEGLMISEEQRSAFERGKSKFGKMQRKRLAREAEEMAAIERATQKELQDRLWREP